ncbi:MAG TPA: nicotinate phosphoribosyltransferase [Candidatus Paceibacterota bacterium]
MQTAEFEKGLKARDFVDMVRETQTSFHPPVRSLMDVDFYKFTMGQFIFIKFRGTEVTFKLIIRDPDVLVGALIREDDLRQSLDYMMGVAFRRTDLYYLRGINLYQANMFNESYLEFLENFRLSPYKLEMKGESIELEFSGPWETATMWETIAVAIVNELYNRAVMRSIPDQDLIEIYENAEGKLIRKLELLSDNNIRFSDFCQRRRHSFLWQKHAVGFTARNFPELLVGTSNTWMAFHYDLIPIGTNAHELPMVLTALEDSEQEMLRQQYRVPLLWQEVYGPGLRIFLPDTYGTAQFFENAPKFLLDWKGFRQDSGDPVQSGYRYINWLKRHGVDPKSKLMIPSDGLDVGSMIEIQKELGDKINLSFGWGTLFGNDFRGCHPKYPLLRPFSMVCKVVSANGRPCVKLSDNIGKATGPKEEIERYIWIFGNRGRISQVVKV